MNNDEIKILKYLSDKLGSGGNILEMLKDINTKHGKTYYPNIYKATKHLEKAGIIKITTEGKNKIISLNKENPFSKYYMAEIEDSKMIKMDIFRELLNDLLSLPEKINIFSMASLETKHHLALNRMELLILAKNHDEDYELIKLLLQVESIYNIGIDPIILTLDEFIKIMKSDELSPIKDLILDKYILYNSLGFWDLIIRNDINSNYKKLNKSPYKITHKELAYNYNRFGFELIEELSNEDKISIETLIFAMSINDEARIRYGSIIVLKKNIDKINLPYLFYIYKRYNKLGLLRSMILSLIEAKGLETNKNIKQYIDLMKEDPNIKFDLNTIKEYIKLYS